MVSHEPIESVSLRHHILRMKLLVTASGTFELAIDERDDPMSDVPKCRQFQCRSTTSQTK
jgi:hypothetical protein